MWFLFQRKTPGERGQRREGLLAEEGRSHLPMNSKGDASMTGSVKVLLAICLKELLPGLRFRVESFGYRI